MERETLITNARLRNAANRYARYIAVCLRHVRTESGTMQLNWLLQVANTIRKNVIYCQVVHNRNRQRQLQRDITVLIECSCELWSDLYYTRAFEVSKDIGPRHTQKAQRILRTTHRLLEQIRAEIGR